MEVRRLLTGEIDLLRDVRLRALRDAPYAFGSTYERESAFGPEEWAQRIATPVFAALDDGRALGMAGGYVDERQETVLWGMWVDPAARGRGLAEPLVEAVVAWARSTGAPRLELSVTDRAPAAAALYRRLGFVPTGETRPLASDPSITEVLMSRAL
jgi:GNAT superfamily N-acetyltransferase